MPTLLGILAIISLVIMLSALPAHAQQFTTVWKHNQSGLELSTPSQDITGPKVIAAIAENGPASGGFGLHTINVSFSETMFFNPATSASSVRNINNYLVTRLGTEDTVEVTNIIYSVTLGALLQLDVTDPDWVRYGDYVLTINNVSDANTNTIAPNTRIPVSWRYATNLIAGSQSWNYHSSAMFDPGVYDETWYAPDYVPGPWWGQDPGGFYGGPTTQFPCQIIAPPQVAMGYQIEPALFRTSFQWPAHWPDSGTLQLRYGADDGVVVYLNGVKVYRNNVSGDFGSAISSESRAHVRFSTTQCITNASVKADNLKHGTNWIAVALVQSTADEPNSYFVFAMDGVVAVGPTLPPEPLPVLQAAPVGTNAIGFSWTGSGYALEASPDLHLGPLSYPLGPWTEVPQMSNPYLWHLTNNSPRFFRLKKW